MDRPKVGVGVHIFNSKNQILLGLRTNSHGSNTWSAPGGHLEYSETPEQTAIRETLEETGLNIKVTEELGYTNDIFPQEEKHYITIHLKAEITAGILELKEPNKCLEWTWFDLDSIPKNLFLPLLKFYQ